MKCFSARKAVSVLLTALLFCMSAGVECRAAALAVAKASPGNGGALLRIPAIAPGASPVMLKSRIFAAGGMSFSASFPTPAVPKPLPWSSAPDELPQAPPVLSAPAALPLAAPAERLGEMAAVILPDLEALQAREVGGEQARGLAERVMAPVIGRTQEPTLLARVAPAAEPLTEKNFMAVLRLLSQKQRSGYELLGQTGLAPEGLRRVIERIDAMGMLLTHGPLQPRDIGSAQVSLKPSAMGAALLLTQPWPGTDTLGSRALDTLALLQTKVRFGYEIMSALALDRSRLENLIAELQATGLIHLSGDFRGPGVDNTLVSILPSNMGKIKAVLERKRLLKLLLPAPATLLEAAATGLAAPALLQAVPTEPLPAPILRRLNPKIAVTPVSEHLPGVIFVKFLRGTTLETMLGILDRNGIKPELYADNGDGFRARVALSEVESGRAAGRLAVEGQVEIVEVNRKVSDMLRQGGAARVEVPSIRASAEWPNKADYTLAGAGTLVAVAAFTLLGAAYALGLAAGGVVVMAAGVALWLEADYQKNQKERGGRVPSGRGRAFRIAGAFLAGAGFTGMAVGLGAQILLASFRESVTVLSAALGGFGGFQLGLKGESRDNGIFHRASDEFWPVAMSTLFGVGLGVVASRVLFHVLGVHAPATMLDGLRAILSGAYGSLLGVLALGIGGVFSRRAPPAPPGAVLSSPEPDLDRLSVTSGEGRPKEREEAARQLDGLLVERLGALAVKEVDVQHRGGRASLVVFLTRPVDENLIPKEHQGIPVVLARIYVDSPAETWRDSWREYREILRDTGNDIQQWFKDKLGRVPRRPSVSLARIVRGGFGLAGKLVGAVLGFVLGVTYVMTILGPLINGVNFAHANPWHDSVAKSLLIEVLAPLTWSVKGLRMGRAIMSESGEFPRRMRSAADPSLPANGHDAKSLHDAYKDWGEVLGGLVGLLLALGVGAWAFAAASASLALPVALFWGAVAALAVGMLTTLGLASLGRDIGDRLGQEKVDRIHLDFLDFHRGRIEAVAGVASVRYQISIPGMTDAVTPADGPLFVVVLDGRVPYETVRRDLRAAVPELDGFPVFFEKGREDR